MGKMVSVSVIRVGMWQTWESKKVNGKHGKMRNVVRDACFSKWKHDKWSTKMVSVANDRLQYQSKQMVNIGIVIN
jgi:hypothetical protein